MTRLLLAAAGVAAGVGAYVFSCAASAQPQMAENNPLDTRRLEPSADSEPLEEISVTATRQPTQVLDVPAVVSVTTRKQIDERQIRDAQDLVRYEPGINVPRQTSGTDPFGNLGSFNIRGVSGNRVQIQVDGTRVQEQITDGNRGFFDFPTLKAVEIQRGPGSVLWGADALGGVVSFRTLDPGDLLDGTRPVAGRTETSFDSFNDRFSKTGMAASQLTPELQAILILNQASYHEGKLRKARADGGDWGCPRVPDAIRCDELNPLDGTSWNALSKFVWTPTDDQKVTLTGEIFDSTGKIQQLYDYGLQPTGAFNGEYERKQDQTRERLSLAHEWNVGTTWLDQLRWQVSFSPQKRELNSDRFTRTALGVERRTYDLLRYEEKFLQGDLQLTSVAETGPVSHRFTYGFQGDFTKTNYERRTLVTDIATGVTTPGAVSGFANAETMRADLYLQDEIKLFDDRLKVTPGARWANYQIDPKGGVYTPIPGFGDPEKQNSSRLIPQIGALYKLTDEYSVYGRYAEGFKMPTAQQLYTSSPGVAFNLIPAPNLKPESVKSYEAGLRAQYGASDYFQEAWFSAGVFKADYANFIQNFYNVPGTNDYTYRNLSQVKIWGLEASGEVRLSDRWSVNGTLSWQRANQRAERGAAKTPFDGAIPLVGVLGVKWRDPALGLEIEGVGTFAQGVKRASSDGQDLPETLQIFKPGGYVVFDLFANWSPPIAVSGSIRAVTFRGAILNMFDKRYFKTPLPYTFNVRPSSAVAISNPLELQTAPGRTFKISASVDF